MSFRQRLPARLVVLSCGIVATGPAMLVGVLVARLAGLDLAGWPAWFAVAAITAVLTGVAGLLSEPLVSRLQVRIAGRRDAP